MSAVRRISVEERRARLALRHRLAPAAPAATPVEAAEGVIALHGTDAASVFLSIWARRPEVTVGAIEDALYTTHALVRMLGMRRTVFVLPRALAPVIQSACIHAIAVQERRRLEQLLVQAGITQQPGPWLAQVEDATLAALRTRGEAFARDLGRDVPQLREQFHFGVGKAYEGYQSVATRVLFLMAAEGRLIRGRPRGSWISSQQCWAPMATVFADGLPEVPKATAQAELVRRWLAAFGPGSVADLKWWTGLTVGEVRAALRQVGAIEVELEATPVSSGSSRARRADGERDSTESTTTGSTRSAASALDAARASSGSGRARSAAAGEAIGYVLPDDLELVAAPAPFAALLPALDPTVMGWLNRAWFLDDTHTAALFDRSGNAGPTVWWAGRVVGGWAQRRDGRVVYRLLEEVGAEALAQIEARAAALQAWLGPVRVTPRFRTPLERTLSQP